MMRSKTRNIVIALVLVAVYALVNHWDGSDSSPSPVSGGDGATVIQEAFDQRRSDVQVRGEGKVVRILADDREGSRHQRFIVELDTGLSLLVAHNIDLAPGVHDLEEGERVSFFGEYEWNAKGGVIHWTHHDPGRRHLDGWIKYRGKTYQ